MCFKDASGVQSTKLQHGSSQDNDYNPDLHEFKSHLLTSKARVAPMDGLTIPRSELTALQLLTRLLSKAIKALSEPPSDVYILGDSTCVISAMDKIATSFNPFMHSRLSDIHHTLDVIREQADVMPINYIPSKENIADLAARSETALSSIGPDSLWQNGPSWLLKPYEQWPATRSFAKEELPDAECKSPIKILLVSTPATIPRCPLVVNALSQCNDYYDAHRRITQNLLDISPKLAPYKGTHALLPNSPISNSDASLRAWSLLCEDAMGETDSLFSQGKLKHFQGSSRTIDCVNRTIYVTSGRMSHTALKAVSGQE